MVFGIIIVIMWLLCVYLVCGDYVVTGIILVFPKIGFGTIIFTIHSGGFSHPYFWVDTHMNDSDSHFPFCVMYFFLYMFNWRTPWLRLQKRAIPGVQALQFGFGCSS